MRVVSGSLCLLSTPLPAPWRDSLPVGAKEGKRKRKKSMNYFLSIQSFPQSSGVCWFHEIASSPGGGLKPSNSLGACSVLGMAGTAQSQRVGLILNDRGPHSGCKKKRVMSFAAQAGLEPFPWLWLILMIQRKHCRFFKVDLANCVMFILRHWKKPKKEGRVGEKFLPLHRSAYILLHQE